MSQIRVKSTDIKRIVIRMKNALRRKVRARLVTRAQSTVLLPVDVINMGKMDEVRRVRINRMPNQKNTMAAMATAVVTKQLISKTEVRNQIQTESANIKTNSMSSYSEICSEIVSNKFALVRTEGFSGVFRGGGRGVSSLAGNIF